MNRLQPSSSLLLCAVLAGLSSCAHSSRPDSNQTIAGQAVAPGAVSAKPDEALDRLMAGNARFVAGQSTHQDLSAERRTEIAQGQKPFATIPRCSDSRVPPNSVFDTGLGNLFVVRVAGNVADDVAIGSIEYAVEHLGARLIVVLGHEKCGAVDATLGAVRSHSEAPGHIQSIVKAVTPAVERLAESPGDNLDAAIHANIKYVANQLAHSKPILDHEVEAGTVKIVGAYYDLESGKVELLEPK